MRVIATYADGTVRDVTREAFVESGNTEVATVDRDGVMTAVRRGEAAVLARYEGAYSATTLTVMGDRSGFVWQQPETWGKIDELVAAKWQRMKILPSGLCSDAEFIRRVYLDLTGLPPTAEQVRAFLGDHATHAYQARRADRPADRQQRLHRALDQQVGGPAAGEPQVPRCGRGCGVPRLDSRGARRQHALRSVRAQDPHGQRLEPGEPGGLLLQDPPRPAEHDGEHHAPVPGRAVQLQQVPRSSVRALDAGPVLPDGRLLRPGRVDAGSGRGRQEDRRHRRRRGQAAVRNRRRQEPGRGDPRADQAVAQPSSRSHATSRSRPRPAADRNWPPGSPRPTTRTSPAATSTGCGATCWAWASSSRWTTFAPATRRRIRNCWTT